MLELSEVETFYGRKQALFGINLKLREGEAAALIGRNGMGKTTTVRSIMGFTPARRGTIIFQGCEITRFPSHRIARAGIGVVPEGRQIFPTLTVYENLIATAANRHAAPSPWTVQKVYELFPRLAERRASLGWQLSGGEQQMLAIGRALMTNPKLLVLDEATEGIAPIIREEIWRCLKTLKAQGYSLLIIDKDIESLAQIAEYCHIVVKGRVVWSGASAAVMADPSIWQQYLAV
jgi:branched-chain amino acid transport system ATP-binding protein